MGVGGGNEPRLVEPEAHDLVDQLQSIGKEASYLVFADEGHDVIKYPNKVRCYTTITDFFKAHLRP